MSTPAGGHFWQRQLLLGYTYIFDGLLSVLMVMIHEMRFVGKMARKCLLGRWSSSVSKATCSLTEGQSWRYLLCFNRHIWGWGNLMLPMPWQRQFYPLKMNVRSLQNEDVLRETEFCKCVFKHIISVSVQSWAVASPIEVSTSLALSVPKATGRLRVLLVGFCLAPEATYQKRLQFFVSHFLNSYLFLLD